jgi:hypothetical protein
MRKLLLMLPIGALVACAAAAPPPPAIGTGSGYVCRQQTFEEFIGQVATSEVAAALLRASGARTIRWALPGMAMTMEFSPERLTVQLASNNRIVSANCG